jgi:RNA polymerase sigma-70 factor (ECF subfamily)
MTLVPENMTAETIARVHREEWARVVAVLTRRIGDLDIAEEMAAEAFAVAVERWPTDGVPPNPGAWITTTANRRAIDRLRRESRRTTSRSRLRCCTTTNRPSRPTPSRTAASRTGRSRTTGSG